MKNYEDYKCKDCGDSGVKLWRDYGYCDELWCAVCCEKIIAKKATLPSPWDEPKGPLDMMRIGFSGVVAIPTDGDCDSYQSAGALKTEQLIWWHALPTFRDERREIETVMYVLRDSRESLAREERSESLAVQKINSLRIQVGKLPKPIPVAVTDAGYGYRQNLEDARRVMLDTLRLLYDTQTRRLDLYREQSDLEWILNRKVVELTAPATVKIWGSVRKEVPMDDGKVLVMTSGEEQPTELVPGQRIAVGRTGSAVLLLGESYRDCPSIMDFDQDGHRLLESLRDKSMTVRGY